MLGDFGLAIYANTPGLNNPWDYIGAGTKVYMAPVSGPCLNAPPLIRAPYQVF